MFSLEHPDKTADVTGYCYFFRLYGYGIDEVIADVHK